MKNLKFNKKRLSAAVISLVMGTTSLIGLSGCKEKTYESDIDTTSTEVTSIFENDTKLDEAIKSEVAYYENMPITEAVDKLEDALYIVDKVERDNSSLVEDVSELEKLSDEDYKKAETLTKDEFDKEFARSNGDIEDKTDNVFKTQETRMHSMKMVEHCYKFNKKFVKENAPYIVEEFLSYSAKAVIANEINVDGEDLDLIKIGHEPTVNDDNKNIIVRVGNDKYEIDPKTEGIGDGISALYNLQEQDNLTNNDYLKFIEAGKKITMLGAKTKTSGEIVEIENDIPLKEANSKIERTRK